MLSRALSAHVSNVPATLFGTRACCRASIASSIFSIFTPREPLSSSKSPGCRNPARNLPASSEFSKNCDWLWPDAPPLDRGAQEILSHAPARQKSNRFFPFQRQRARIRVQFGQKMSPSSRISPAARIRRR